MTMTAAATGRPLVRAAIVGLSAVMFLAAAFGQAGSPVGASSGRAIRQEAARFAAFDIYVDPAGKPMAAYQVVVSSGHLDPDELGDLGSHP